MAGPEHDEYAIDPQVAARVAHLRGVSVEQFFTVGVDAPPPPIVEPIEGVVWSEDLLDTTDPSFRVRRYSTGPGADGARPCLVWCHGGGWGLGDLDMVEAHVVAQRVASTLDAIVYSVDYGLAPAQAYPVPQEQIVAAVEHAMADPEVDPLRLALGGASAGGHLAACAAHRLAVAGAPLAALFFAYPVVDPLDGPYPDRRPDACPELLWFDADKTSALFAKHAGASPPSGSVPMRLDADGLPPTLITTVPADGLGPQAVAYVEHLAAAGVDAEHHEVSRVLHGYLDMTGSVDIADAALDRHLSWLGAALR
ncbi:MAG: alpha/beta hydrolase fold domain-containing protein [Acidimicrobiales bacterium]|nr:alpha/beta hydrolase fold domain-containing protein [Acidimicrobiales bacterium]